MKANAKDIVVQSYSLVCSDEMLSQWRTENRGVSMSNGNLRAKLLKDRIMDLIGDAERKDSFFIYGRGSVSHAIHIMSYQYLLTYFMQSMPSLKEHLSIALSKKCLSRQYLLQVKAWIV